MITLLSALAFGHRLAGCIPPEGRQLGQLIQEGLCQGQRQRKVGQNRKSSRSVDPSRPFRNNDSFRRTCRNLYFCIWDMQCALVGNLP